MAQTLQFHQRQVNEHKRHLSHVIEDNRWVVVAILVIPAFIVGWLAGGKKRGGAIIKQFGELVALAAVAAVKEKVSLALKNNSQG